MGGNLELVNDYLRNHISTTTTIYDYAMNLASDGAP